MNTQEAINNAIEYLTTAVNTLPRVSAEALGLDYRAGMVYVDLESRAIIVKGGNARSLAYYGGFEYVPEGNVTSIGPFTIYSEEGEDGECERIIDALDHFEENYEAS
jgi:hypothetical protein